MARLVNSDLSTMNSSKALASIEELSSWLSKCSLGITDFNSDSLSHLIGGGYDAVRKRLTLYVDALNKLKSICDDSFSSIKSVNSDFSAYMEGEPVLDDSELANAKSSLQSARDTLADLYANTETKNYSSQVSYYESQIAFLEKKVRLLEGLASKDSSLYGKINTINSSLNNFNTALSYVDSNVFGNDNIKKILKGEVDASKIDVNCKYTKEQIKSMTEKQVKNMSVDEFIEFVGSAAVRVYNEKGGVLPSITIAQALYETGAVDGASFWDNSYNLYGLIGYPADKPLAGGRRFDNFYEATEYHSSYFEEYEKVFPKFLYYCGQNDALSAVPYLKEYDLGHQSYSDSVGYFIKKYDLTRFDSLNSDIVSV